VAYDEGLAVRLLDILGEEAGLAEKKMFGGLAVLLGGNMAVPDASNGTAPQASIAATMNQAPPARNGTSCRVSRSETRSRLAKRTSDGSAGTGHYSWPAIDPLMQPLPLSPLIDLAAVAASTTRTISSPSSRV
jgi:hypothetical protein